MSKRFWEWKPTFEIKAKETAFLLIDMQKGFVDEGAALEVPMAREQVPVMADFAAFCRQKKIPVFFSKFVFDKDNSYDFYYKMAAQRGLKCDESGNDFAPENPETEIISALAPEENDIVFPKYGYDCFAHSEFEKKLKELNIRTLIIAGTVVNWCVDSTVRSAYHRDYNVVVMADGVSGYNQAGLSGETWRNIELDLFAEGFGRVLNEKNLKETIKF